GIEHDLAFSPVSTRRETNQDAGGETAMDRRLGSWRDLAAGAQQSSGHVDGDQLVPTTADSGDSSTAHPPTPAATIQPYAADATICCGIYELSTTCGRSRRMG